MTVDYPGESFYTPYKVIDISNQTMHAMADNEYVLNPKFKWTSEELKFTDVDTNWAYLGIYENLVYNYEYNLEQFKFDVVIYDEIEHFPNSIKNDRFYYPYTSAKTELNQIAVDFNSQYKHVEVVKLQKSTVCLE